MNKQQKTERPIYLFRFGIKGLLFATLVVAVYLGGRHSMMPEIDRLKAENEALKNPAPALAAAWPKPFKVNVNLPNQWLDRDYVLVGKGNDYDNFQVTPEIIDMDKTAEIQFDNVLDSEADDPTEMGMKASELEMKDRIEMQHRLQREFDHTPKPR